MPSLSIRFSLLVCVAGAAACTGNVGHFDGGIFDDTDAGFAFQLADIGSPCTYDANNQVNPTTTCKSGLTCLISTRDSLFMNNPGFQIPVWEDHFTRFLSDGHTDVGQCTLVGTHANPPACPAGTVLKTFSADVAACLRTCEQAADCTRDGDVCDVRYFDMTTPVCVNGCSLDVPDCVRSGNIFFDATSQVLTHLDFADLRGESICNTQTGICTANAVHGVNKPGEACVTTRDCASPMTCWQGGVFSADQGSPGFCGLLCTPGAASGEAGACSVGFACQAGLLLGFPGNPLGAVGDGQGFLIANTDTGEFLEGGGFCFPECTEPTNCASFAQTTCGSADDAVLSLLSPTPVVWNEVPMCLVDGLRR